jgi:hypothetical protein
MRISTYGGLAVALALLAGCSTTPPPRTEIARADVIIEQAEIEEAAQFAPRELREAQQKLQQARAAVDAQEFDKADLLAQEAQVSAQLALAETQSLRAERLVQESLSEAQGLRQELQQRREATR